MKNIFLLLLIISSSFFAFSQTLPLSYNELFPKWERIFLKDVGSFDLPPTMEVQKGKYKEFNNEFKKIKGFDTSQLTAQQKGLNEFKKDGLGKYARVMLETNYGSPNEFEKLFFNITEFTKSDINEVNTLYKQQLQQSFNETGFLKLIEWYPLKFEKVNGMSCIHIRYKRQLQDSPYVFVHRYYFHNNDRIHSLTLSYRLSEADYWKEDFATILKSFRISNIR